MKKFTGLVVILAALVLGSYYGMGYLTEKKVRETLDVINQTNGLNVQVAEYNRGWFSSSAVFDWHLQIPEHVMTTANGQSETVPAEEHQLTMPVKVYHGPVIFANHAVKFGFGYAHSVLALPEKVVDRFKSVFTSESIQPKLDLNLFVNFLDKTSIELSVPAFKLIAKEGNGQFEWKGLSSDTSVSSDMNKIAGSLNVEGFTITKNQLKTVMSSIHSEYNLHRNDAGLYLGDANVSFPSLIVTNNGQEIFELSQFEVQSDTNIENGLFNSHFKTSINKVVANSKTYGPGSLEVAIRNLDADVLAQINQQVNQIQQGNDPQRQQAMLAILPELPRLFSKGAEFEISEMNFTMPQGKIEGKMLLSLPKENIVNPFELVQKIQGNGKLAVPAVVLKDLLTESFRQKLMAPPSPQTIEQGIVQQMQKQTGQGPNPPAAGANNPQNNQPGSTSTPAPAPNPAQVEQQSAVLADKQLASMVQSGIIMQKDNDYVIELKLSQGQLTVNGKPFSSEMLKFQQ